MGTPQSETASSGQDGRVSAEVIISEFAQMVHPLEADVW